MARGRITIIAALLVILPLAALLLLSSQLLQRERASEDKRLQELTLRALDRSLADLSVWIEQMELDLKLGMRSVIDAESLQDNPLVLQAFSIGKDGQLAYPGAEGTSSERDFLAPSKHIWLDKLIFESAGEGRRQVADWGWHTWYWERGPRHLLWVRRGDGQTFGAELSGARLLADLIALLPDTAGGAVPGEFALLGHRGKSLYSWGDSGDGDAVQTLHLPEPFGDWRLGLKPSRILLGSGARSAAALQAGVAALILAVLALAVVLLRELTRAAREAQQRVTFVNQVSHELKTPLTNIRMYAEIVEARETDERGRRYMGVIVSESHRLGRMIANVLSFARQQRNDLTLTKSPLIVDQELATIAEQFQPLLEAKGLELRLDLGAPGLVLADADVLAQIVGNLVSNAEKYGAGSVIHLQSRGAAGKTDLRVSDSGPGVAVRDRERIFEPFVRVNEGLSDSAGTGIGLAISRELARRHGGGLGVVPSDVGAVFVCTLATPEAES